MNEDYEMTARLPWNMPEGDNWYGLQICDSTVASGSGVVSASIVAGSTYFPDLRPIPIFPAEQHVLNLNLIRIYKQIYLKSSKNLQRSLQKIWFPSTKEYQEDLLKIYRRKSNQIFFRSCKDFQKILRRFLFEIS